MVVLLTLGIVTGCASSQAAALAHQACGHVAKAERLQHQADAASGARAHGFSIRAERQLEIAEPLAAMAAGDDPTWQALQADLSQVPRMPNSVILPSLRAACAQGS